LEIFCSFAIAGLAPSYRTGGLLGLRHYASAQDGPVQAVKSDDLFVRIFSPAYPENKSLPVK
jgi:hypothetical protein